MIKISSKCILERQRKYKFTFICLHRYLLVLVSFWFSFSLNKKENVLYFAVEMQVTS